MAGLARPLSHLGATPPEFYFSQDDIGNDAQLARLVSFHFACYGAGTPLLDDSAHEQGTRDTIAPHAFVAGLPKRPLSHPAGGALAVIGPVSLIHNNKREGITRLRLRLRDGLQAFPTYWPSLTERHRTQCLVGLMQWRDKDTRATTSPSSTREQKGVA